MTVEFDAETNKLKWYLIDKEQAQKYIDFLDREIGRHSTEVSNSEAEMHKYKYQLLDEFTVLLWESSVKRHRGDIERERRRIEEVKKWFKMEE